MPRVPRRDFMAVAGAAGLGLPSATGGRGQRRRPEQRLSATPVIDGLGYLDFHPASRPLVGPQLLQDLRASGLDALAYTVNADSFEATVATLAHWSAQIAAHPEDLLMVREVTDIESAHASRRTGVIFAFQDPSPLDGQLDRVTTFHDLGVRVIQITENLQNEFGAGCSEPRDGGLSLLGHDLVARLESAGVLVDLSHCGERTTRDAIDAATGPVAITHSTCRALYDVPRAKSDEVIRALAGKGGVFGVALLNFFIGPRDDNGLEGVMAHIHHLARLVGIEHVGIGSDLTIGSFLRVFPDRQSFDAALAPYIERTGASYVRWPATIGGLDGPTKYAVLADALRDEYSPAEVEGVLGGNFLRLFGAAWR